MENIVESVETLVKKSLVVDIDGKKYSAVSLTPVRDNPTIPALGVEGLSGLVDFVDSKMDEEMLKTKLIHVVDYQKVKLSTKLDSETKTRQTLLCAEVKDAERFHFGSYMDAENFIISLKSLFVKNEAQEQLLRFVSSLTVNNTITTKDDGISQSATINKGMSGAVKESGSSPSIIALRPYRTFREIEQPESEFLFRMKSGGSGLPQCALFEADGGAWKITAVQTIKKFLNDALSVRHTVTIIG